MAAEVVVWKNLTRTFLENQWLTDVKKLLQELKVSVMGAEQAMAALEERNTIAILEEDNPVSNKIRNLGALMYQADDLLDEILTFYNGRRTPRASSQDADQSRNNRGNQQTGSRITRKVSQLFSTYNPLVFPFKMGSKIREINRQIQEIMNQLRNEFGSSVQSQREFVPPGPIILTENKIIGRDKDKDNFIKMLLQPRADNKTNVSVIPIVGSPGVGKSTLAKYVYEDRKVDNRFDLKIWIKVSHITEEAEVIREIVEACTNRKSNACRFSRRANNSHSQFFDILGCRSFDRSLDLPSSSTSINETDISESRLRKEIKGKLFLLVLDDALIVTWQRLQDLLAGGAKGSHILVTTRSDDVADLSKSDGYEAYQLKGLVESDSKSLFNTFAFGKEAPREPKMEAIGVSIAKKCKGVPLTIKVAASCLYKKNIDDWSSFETSMNGVELIMKHVLDSSYTDLPTCLKACFCYCSLFPEDHIFNKRDLISLWTAQGYVDQPDGQSLVEHAEAYFVELSRRCFFEEVSKDDLGNIVTCKMHPIMRRLAGHYATGTMNSYIADSRVKQAMDAECKHVTFISVGDSSMKLIPTLFPAQNLRTLLSVKEADCDAQMHKSVCDTLMSNLICLRVLDLNDLRIDELPNSIGKLMHLRYLDLSKNSLVILPQSVTELLNLQTLKLNSCMRLKRLPGNFGQLVNLKRFEIDECDSLTCMPLGLEQLTQLETLSHLIVSKNCSAELGALRDLSSLSGQLAIELSGDWATSLPEVQQANLQKKVSLEELKISWGKTEAGNSSYQKLLEQLQPNLDLKILRIEGYKGENFPSWVQKDLLTCLPHLVVVSIEGCSKCEHLPPFGRLSKLKQLTLRHMTNVKYVEEETSQDQIPFFPCLEELTLHNFYKLEGWRKEVMVTSGFEATRSFFNLRKLKIWNCPHLKSMPLFMEVIDLDLRNVNQILLEECANKASKIEKESKIAHLLIKGCRNLKSFEAVREGLGGLHNLKELVVERCDALSSLASELRHLSSLERLEMSSCKKLNLSDNGIIAAGNSSTMSWIPRRIICHKKEIPKNPWASLICLRHLTLRGISKMEVLPEGLQYVQSLKTLWISGCLALKALPEWISSLTALQHLRIESCPGLTRLPDGIKEVKSLVKVEITDSEKLMERCRVHTGEDWHKIKHAWVLLHKSWRYGLMSELGTSQKKSNIPAITDVRYIIVPVIATEADT